MIRRTLSGSPFRRLGGFALIPLIGAITPLFVLPAITSMHGAEGWAAIAIGQSIGGGASVLVELGWALNGPQLVARLIASERTHAYVLSIVSKLLVYVVVGPLSAGVAFLLAPENQTSAALAAVATAALGLSPIWFFIGTGQPSRILYSDTLQRIALTAASAGLLLIGLPLITYPALALTSALIAPFVGYMFVRRVSVTSHSVTLREIGSTFRRQSTALLGRSISAIYISLPVAIVSIVSPNSVVVFAAAERLQRMGLGVLQSFPNSLQGWVGSASDSQDAKRRLRKTLKWNLILGVVAGIGFASLGPLASRIIFTGEATIPFELSALCGLVIFATCVSRATGGLALVAYGRIASITVSAAVGGIVGILAIAFLSLFWGSVGAVLGEVAAEFSVLAVQIFLLRRVWKSQIRSYDEDEPN